MAKYEKGELIAQGKTKRIWAVKGHPDLVIVGNCDAITKNDDASQTRQMTGKAVYATTTTCAMFELLRAAGVPVAFIEQISPTEFVAPRCKMVPLEVIIRRYAVGSYLRRLPHLRQPKGMPPHRFHQLVFELFLKTTGGTLQFDGTTIVEKLPVDDPWICNPESPLWKLVHPKVPSWEDGSDLGYSVREEAVGLIGHGILTRSKVEENARRVFLILEAAWAQLGLRLIDFKIEFGVDTNGNLLVADVIDNDSWRLRDWEWNELSKQLFRDCAGMDKIADKYALVAQLVKQLRIPQQALVLWRGSESDPLPEVPNIAGVNVVEITASGHKSPQQCLKKLEEVLAQYPEGGVILALVGMSNGLGPVLAARTNWPVIGVSLTAGDHPEDVWSSLRLPSQVPMMTVVSPKNAILAALNILSQKNPVAAAARRQAIELLDH